MHTAVMPGVVEKRGQGTTARCALLVAVALALVLFLTPQTRDNELFTSTGTTVLTAALCLGLALMARRTSRLWGLGIVIGAAAAAPLYVACLFFIVAIGGPPGG
jgi:hypothetical protein